jgi:hypothetical protein
MTLKEQFEDILKVTNKLWNKVDAESCEQIAEEFAIGFAEWCVIKKVRFFDDTKEGMIFTVDLYKTKYTTKELLEIYKKEKGL